jgi:hypothetical protein
MGRMVVQSTSASRRQHICCQHPCFCTFLPLTVLGRLARPHTHWTDLHPASSAALHHHYVCRYKPTCGVDSRQFALFLLDYLHVETAMYEPPRLPLPPSILRNQPPTCPLLATPDSPPPPPLPFYHAAFISLEGNESRRINSVANPNPNPDLRITKGKWTKVDQLRCGSEASPRMASSQTQQCRSESCLTVYLLVFLQCNKPPFSAQSEEL